MVTPTPPAMDALSLIGERRIAEAVARGDLRDLPNQGRPLPEDDLAGVPRELHTSVIILRNAEVLPPALELRREILRLDDLLRACVDAVARERLADDARRARLRLALLLDQTRGNGTLLEYQDQLVQRLADGRGA